MAIQVDGTISAPTGTLNQATQNGTANTFAMYTSTGGLLATGTLQGSNFASGASVAGSNTGDITIGTANGLSLTGQALSLGIASGTATGALSSTDWTTFNAKQSALTFAQSLTNTSGTVTLTGDASAPGNMMYYGTDGTGVKGYHGLSSLGGGTVSSVGLNAPGSLFTVTGSPVTTSGNISLSLVTQPANQVFAGPNSGAAAAPTWRTLDGRDVSPFVTTTAPTGTYAPAGGMYTYVLNTAGNVSVTLGVPTASTRITFVNAGTGTLTLAQAATVQAYYGNNATTAGTGGSGVLLAQGASVTLIANGTSPVYYASDVTGGISVT